MESSRIFDSIKYCSRKVASDTSEATESVAVEGVLAYGLSPLVALPPGVCWRLIVLGLVSKLGMEKLTDGRLDDGRLDVARLPICFDVVQLLLG